MVGNNNLLGRHASLLMTCLPCQLRRLRPPTLPTIMATKSAQSWVPELRLAANRPSHPPPSALRSPTNRRLRTRRPCTGRPNEHCGSGWSVLWHLRAPRPALPPVLSFSMSMLCSIDRCCFLLLILGYVSLSLSFSREVIEGVVGLVLSAAPGEQNGVAVTEMFPSNWRTSSWLELNQRCPLFCCSSLLRGSNALLVTWHPHGFVMV